MSHSPPPDHQNCFSDRAVSPVIGVVLMVAITIILAAIMGAFVMGFSPGSSDVAPVATVTFTVDDDNLTIVHEGGDGLDLEEHSLLIDGDREEGVTAFNRTLASGESLLVEGVLSEDPSDPEVILRHDPSGELIASETVALD